MKTNPLTELILETQWINLEENFDDSLSCNKIRWRLYDKYGNEFISEFEVTEFDIETCENIFQNEYEFMVKQFINSWNRHYNEK